MRCPTRLFPLLFVLSLVAACGSGDDIGADPVDEVGTSTTQSPPTTAATTTDVTTWRGSVEKTMQVGDASRSYLLFAPPTLDSAGPAPLVLSMHGITETARTQETSGFNETAEREGVVVVYPDAVRGTWDMATTRDVEFIAAIIDEVSASMAIDPDRVYAIGFSQGGAFSTFLACHLPDRITAVASVASLVYHDAPACPAQSPARILTFAGETDRIVSIEEGLLISSPDPDPPGPLADETQAWATTNSCDRDPIEVSLPEGVVRHDYDCANGSELMVYIHPGGHLWPVDVYGLDANAIIWEFLDQYTAPLPTE